MMKEPEEAIEKVLAGLRSASAPIGMDHRIIEALEARASVRPQWGWPWWTLASQPPCATRFVERSVGVAVVCAVALLVTANRRLTHVESPSKRSWNSVASLPVAPSEFATNGLEVTPFRSGVRMKATKPERKVSGRKPRVVDDSGSLALEEMRAASHPPPPMPLTDQEKLLLRIAHKGDPVEVAELNPVLRAARFEEEKAEVQRFFKSVRSGDNE